MVPDIPAVTKKLPKEAVEAAGNAAEANPRASDAEQGTIAAKMILPQLEKDAKKDTRAVGVGWKIEVALR